MKWSFHERSFITSAISMWRLCLNIHDVINTCDDTIYNLSAYVCDWSLGTHKILHPILSLKSGVIGSKKSWVIQSNQDVPVCGYMVANLILLCSLKTSLFWNLERILQENKGYLFISFFFSCRHLSTHCFRYLGHLSIFLNSFFLSFFMNNFCIAHVSFLQQNFERDINKNLEHLFGGWKT